MKFKVVPILVFILLVGVTVGPSISGKNLIEYPVKPFFGKNSKTWIDIFDRINYRYTGQESDLITLNEPRKINCYYQESVEVVSKESTKDSIIPMMKVDTEGTIHVVWMDKTNYSGSGNDFDIFYKRKPSGSNWTISEIVSTDSNCDSFEPILDVDRYGNVHVVWWDVIEESLPVSILEAFYKMKPKGGNWTLTEPIFKEIPNLSYEPHLAVDWEGTVHVTWTSWTNYGDSGSDIDVFYRKKPYDGSWSDVEVVSSESNNVSYWSTIGVGPDGTVHVAWSDLSNYRLSLFYEDIFYKMKSSNGNWIKTQVVSRGRIKLCSFDPQLVIESDGTVHLSWWGLTYLGKTPIGLYAFYSKKPPDGRWTLMEKITNKWGAQGTSLTVDKNSTVHMGLNTINPFGGFGVLGYSACYLNKPISGVWSPPQHIMIHGLENEWDEVDSGHPCVVVDPDDTLHVVWEDNLNYTGSGTDWDIFYRNDIVVSKPPTKPSVTGPRIIKELKGYNYTVVSTDPEDDDIYYRVTPLSVGCGVQTLCWMGPYPSGEEIKVPLSICPGNWIHLYGFVAMDVNGAISKQKLFILFCSPYS